MCKFYIFRSVPLRPETNYFSYRLNPNQGSYYTKKCKSHTLTLFRFMQIRCYWNHAVAISYSLKNVVTSKVLLFDYTWRIIINILQWVTILKLIFTKFAVLKEPTFKEPSLMYRVISGMILESSGYKSTFLRSRCGL